MFLLRLSDTTSPQTFSACYYCNMEYKTVLMRLEKRQERGNDTLQQVLGSKVGITVRPERCLGTQFRGHSLSRPCKGHRGRSWV